METTSISFLQGTSQTRASAPAVSIPETFVWDEHTGRYETQHSGQMSFVSHRLATVPGVTECACDEICRTVEAAGNF